MIVCPECPSSLPDRCNRGTWSVSERRAPTQAPPVITPADDSSIKAISLSDTFERQQIAPPVSGDAG